MGVTVNVVKREQVVVASVLTNDTPPGPAVCTTLAYWPYWESVEAAQVAKAMVLCAQKGFPTRANLVKALVEPEYRDWIDHPIFQDGLPMGLAEVEARSLLPHYKNKRLLVAIGRAYEVIMDNPECAVKVAKSLLVTIQDCL